MALMNLSPRSLQLKFGQPEQTRARLLHLQESGTALRLSNDGSGWVSKEGDSAADPNNRGDDITDVSSVKGDPSDDELNDVLRQVGNLHRQAIGILSDYASKIQKAKPNPNGTSEPGRKINSNADSSKPGPRASLLSADKLREQIEFVKKERAKTEERLELEAELQKERAAYWDARIKTLHKQDCQ